MVEYVHALTTEAADRAEGITQAHEAVMETLGPLAKMEAKLAAGLDSTLLDDSAREIATSTFDIVILACWRHAGWHKDLMTLATMLMYSEWAVSKHSYFRGRKRVEDVEDLVRRWHDTLVQMSTAHSHEGFTGAEHSTDDLLRPLLTAPIAQLREFAAKLAERLEQDARVPFLVWSSYKSVVAPLIHKRPEGKVLELRETLGREIAEMVTAEIPREDLVSAIAGALSWRGLKQLQETKVAVQAGATPRVTGRQSCLFLTTVNAEGREISQVIL